jgi:hypothetical protein
MKQPSKRGRERRYLVSHARKRWLYYAAIFLGVWLVSTPLISGYTDPATIPEGVRPVTAERALLPVGTRATLILINDLAAGIVTVVLGILSLSPRRIWAPWALALVGVWLLFAPILLWSPSPAAYAVDSLVGIALVSGTVLAGGMPGMPLVMQMGPEVPPGWSYNPSSWLQRMPIIALGWLGFFISRYLAAYQLGYTDAVWDPFFAEGTQRILESRVSHAWPVSDAGLGSVIYAGEALMGYMGGPGRWRTMPWMVTFFGILVVPLGVVSIGLVIMQPVAVGTWCTLCLVTAGAMVIMIPLALDEVVAMLQFWIARIREGEPAWRTFILGYGGPMAPDRRSPGLGSAPGSMPPASVWGVTLPPTLLACVALGAWLMASPYLFDAAGSTAGNVAVISGAVAITIAMVALAEVTRSARFVNVALGAWIAASGWLLGAPFAVAVNGVVVGAALALLSLPRGAIAERYGSWSRFVR